jgi:transcriptional regulator with XRE-family HTH domain
MKDQEWEAYLYEQGEATGEHMALLKALRLAAGLTQQELSVATGIYPGKITDAERDIRALNEEQWERIQLVCDDRINIFKRDAGLTIKLG